MVRSWCDSAKSFHVVPVYTVQCTVEIHLADFFLFVFHQWQKNPPNFIHTNTTMTYDLQNRGNLVKRRQNCMGVNCMDGQQTRTLVYAGSYTACCEEGGPWRVLSTKSTLRSWWNLVKWPYGVKKISIKWLLPVKVTLEVIKRHPRFFADLVVKTLKMR